MTDEEAEMIADNLAPGSLARLAMETDWSRLPPLETPAETSADTEP